MRDQYAKDLYLLVEFQKKCVQGSIIVNFYSFKQSVTSTLHPKWTPNLISYTDFAHSLRGG